MNPITENMQKQTFNHDDVLWAAKEVARQGDGPLHVAYMIRGLAYARLFGPDTPISDHNVIQMNIVVLGGNSGGYRQTDVSFRNTVKEATPWQHVMRQMSLLLDAQENLSVDEFTKQFLDIHPFEDGNGRVASLLYNIKNGSTGNPVMLPNYYGE